MKHDRISVAAGYSAGWLVLFLAGYGGGSGYPPSQQAPYTAHVGAEDLYLDGNDLHWDADDDLTCAAAVDDVLACTGGQYTLTSPETITPAVTISGGGNGTYSRQLLLRNPYDLTGGGYPDDYQNEVHLQIWPGTTTDHRGYIDWANYQGTDKWRIGRNAGNYFILYNTDTNHRVWLDPSSGISYLNSYGTDKSVTINGLPGDSNGTGGLEVWRGTGAGITNTVQHELDYNGHDLQNGAARVFSSDSVLTVGAACTPGHVSGAGATCLGGGVEINGNIYLDGYTYVYSSQYNLTGIPHYYGTSADYAMMYNAVNTCGWLETTGDNTVVMATQANRAVNYSVPAATNPTLHIHSASTTTTHWLSLTHDQTNGVIDSGLGGVRIADECKIDGVSSDGTGKAVCVKSDGTLGTCSDAVGAGGTCTCG